MAPVSERGKLHNPLVHSLWTSSKLKKQLNQLNQPEKRRPEPPLVLHVAAAAATAAPAAPAAPAPVSKALPAPVTVVSPPSVTLHTPDTTELAQLRKDAADARELLKQARVATAEATEHVKEKEAALTRVTADLVSSKRETDLLNKAHAETAAKAEAARAAATADEARNTALAEATKLNSELAQARSEEHMQRLTADADAARSALAHVRAEAAAARRSCVDEATVKNQELAGSAARVDAADTAAKAAKAEKEAALRRVDAARADAEACRAELVLRDSSASAVREDLARALEAVTAANAETARAAATAESRNKALAEATNLNAELAQARDAAAEAAAAMMNEASGRDAALLRASAESERHAESATASANELAKMTAARDAASAMNASAVKRNEELENERDLASRASEACNSAAAFRASEKTALEAAIREHADREVNARAKIDGLTSAVTAAQNELSQTQVQYQVLLDEVKVDALILYLDSKEAAVTAAIEKATAGGNPANSNKFGQFAQVLEDLKKESVGALVRVTAALREKCKFIKSRRNNPIEIPISFAHTASGMRDMRKLARTLHEELLAITHTDAKVSSSVFLRMTPADVYQLLWPSKTAVIDTGLLSEHAIETVTAKPAPQKTHKELADEEQHKQDWKRFEARYDAIQELLPVEERIKLVEPSRFSSIEVSGIVAFVYAALTDGIAPSEADWNIVMKNPPPVGAPARTMAERAAAEAMAGRVRSQVTTSRFMSDAAFKRRLDVKRKIEQYKGDGGPWQCEEQLRWGRDFLATKQRTDYQEEQNTFDFHHCEAYRAGQKVAATTRLPMPLTEAMESSISKAESADQKNAVAYQILLAFAAHRGKMDYFENAFKDIDAFASAKHADVLAVALAL
jgi:hypothetical protein